ncbi:MAG: ABC transporter substrate-binding protein [Hyphomicrobiaceae bacterium]|nr:ABC transporter substrate-binding protein [Hyphomicrobiaceae bacterium]
MSRAGILPHVGGDGTHPAMRLARRWVALLGVVMASLAATPASAEQPARYMQGVANELMTAARTGTADAFHQVFRKHADLPSIGLYSLGSYAQSLSNSDRDPYYSGMIGWIARYSAQNAPQYPVAKMVVVGQTEETKAGVYVDTVVSLQSGSNYDVRWWLIRRGGTFKVGDVNVAGFWGREELKRLFEGFIAKNGGNPRALVLALNQ